MMSSISISSTVYIIIIVLMLIIFTDGIEPMEFAFPEEDLAISRYDGSCYTGLLTF